MLKCKICFYYSSNISNTSTLQWDNIQWLRMPSWTNFSWYSGLVLDSSQFFITQKILFISKKVQSGSKIIIIVGIATFMHFVLQCDNRLFGHQVHKLTGIHKTLQNAGSQTRNTIQIEKLSADRSSLNTSDRQRLWDECDKGGVR